MRRPAVWEGMAAVYRAALGAGCMPADTHAPTVAAEPAPAVAAFGQEQPLRESWTLFPVSRAIVPCIKIQKTHTWPPQHTPAVSTSPGSTIWCITCMHAALSHTAQQRLPWSRVACPAKQIASLQCKGAVVLCHDPIQWQAGSCSLNAPCLAHLHHPSASPQFLPREAQGDGSVLFQAYEHIIAI